MPDGLIGDVERLTSWGRAVALPGCVGQMTEREDGLDLRIDDQCIEPTMPILGNLLIVVVLFAGALAVHAEEIRVDHDVAARQAEFCEEPLQAMPGPTHEDASRDRLLRRRILADDQQARLAVEATAMKDRSTLDAEVGCRVR